MRASARVGAACAGLYGLSILVLLLSGMGRGWGFVDLDVYRLGARGVLDGAHLYALRFPGALAFTYPPTAALALTPLALAPVALLRPLVSAASFALLPVALTCALRLPPIRATLTRDRAIGLALLLSALAIWLEPVWTTLRYGQIDLLIAALILYDLSRPDTARFKGAGIGLATALKLTPAIFALCLLLTRRRRAAAVSLGVFAAGLALGLLALPGDSREYWSGAFADPSRVGRIENAANQTLRGAWARLLHSTHVQGWWLASAVLIGALGIALAALAGRRGDDAAGFSLCALTGLLVSPISWSHHWTLAVPALAILGLLAWRARSRGLLVATALATALAASQIIWRVPVNHPRHSELHLDPVQLLFADAYVLLGIATLGIAALAALMSPRRAFPT